MLFQIEIENCQRKICFTLLEKQLFSYTTTLYLLKFLFDLKVRSIIEKRIVAHEETLLKLGGRNVAIVFESPLQDFP